MRDTHQQTLSQRVRRLGLTTHALLLVIAAAYWFTQVVEGSDYRRLADNNRLRQVAIEAPRGLIIDRQDRPLVENIPSYNLFLDRSLSSEHQASLHFAAPILEQPPAELELLLEQYRGTPSFHPVLMAEGLSLAQVARFRAEQLEHPEFSIQVEHQRLYRHAHQTAHVLGYVGEATQADLQRQDRPYLPGDLAGKRGIEGQYEDLLRGMHGEQVVVVDSRGRLIEEHRSDPATPGRDLQLTLDLELQQEAARLLEDRVGAIVAMDPRSGDILAMVSSPSFNPNRFARRLKREEWRQLIENPHDPLQNRTVQNTHSPGSLFKIVMGVAGLEERLITEDETVTCHGAAQFYNHRRRCWKRSGHGRVNLEKAIRYSCDIYFYQLGQKLGIETIARYARLFGLGRATGIDLAGEQVGLVPDNEWSRRRRGTPWYPGETISVAIGQGPMLVTPVQMAVLTAAVANGGKLLQPRLVAAGEPQVNSTLDGVSMASLRAVQEAMWSVVNERDGTGVSARIAGMEIAGKTGTVQVIRQETWTDSDTLARHHRDHAWFTSYGPSADPQLVVVVFAENAGKGSRDAAPLAKALYEKFFQADLAHRPAS